MKRVLWGWIFLGNLWVVHPLLQGRPPVSAWGTGRAGLLSGSAGRLSSASGARRADEVSSRPTTTSPPRTFSWCRTVPGRGAQISPLRFWAADEWEDSDDAEDGEFESFTSLGGQEDEDDDDEDDDEDDDDDDEDGDEDAVLYEFEELAKASRRSRGRRSSGTAGGGVTAALGVLATENVEEEDIKLNVGDALEVDVEVDEDTVIDPYASVELGHSAEDEDEPTWEPLSAQQAELAAAAAVVEAKKEKKREATRRSRARQKAAKLAAAKGLASAPASEDATGAASRGAATRAVESSALTAEQEILAKEEAVRVAAEAASARAEAAAWARVAAAKKLRSSKLGRLPIASLPATEEVEEERRPQRQPQQALASQSVLLDGRAQVNEMDTGEQLEVAGSLRTAGRARTAAVGEDGAGSLGGGPEARLGGGGMATARSSGRRGQDRSAAASAASAVAMAPLPGGEGVGSVVATARSSGGRRREVALAAAALAAASGAAGSGKGSRNGSRRGERVDGARSSADRIFGEEGEGAGASLTEPLLLDVEQEEEELLLVDEEVEQKEEPLLMDVALDSAEVTALEDVETAAAVAATDPPLFEGETEAVAEDSSSCVGSGISEAPVKRGRKEKATADTGGDSGIDSGVCVEATGDGTKPSKAHQNKEEEEQDGWEEEEGVARVVDGSGLAGLTEDEAVQRLIAAGILHEDGAVLDVDDEEEEGEGGVDLGMYNEVEVPGGDDACQLLAERLSFDEEGIKYLRDNFPPLRGELWYRREQTPGVKGNKKFLDIYFLEETLPELLDLLLGGEEAGGLGFLRARAMFTTTPSLVGLDVREARAVTEYLRDDVGLDREGQLAGALAACPPMLMYHAKDNLGKKVQYYEEALAWSRDDICSMLAVYPNLMSIKLEDDVIEIIEYLRLEVGLQPDMVSGMILEFPEILEIRTKRLKAVVKYLWKVLEIPRSGVAVLLSQYPRACSLEAEANLAPLRHFFERELFVEDAARIGRLVYKFPQLLFKDVATELVPRAEDFRKAMGLEGLEPLPPRIRSRPKSNYRPDRQQGEGNDPRKRGAAGGSGRAKGANGAGGGLAGRGRGRGGRGGRMGSRGAGGRSVRGRGADGGRGGGPDEGGRWGEVDIEVEVAAGVETIKRGVQIAKC